MSGDVCHHRLVGLCTPANTTLNGGLWHDSMQGVSCMSTQDYAKQAALSCTTLGCSVHQACCHDSRTASFVLSSSRSAQDNCSVGRVSSMNWKHSDLDKATQQHQRHQVKLNLVYQQTKPRKALSSHDTRHIRAELSMITQRWWVLMTCVFETLVIGVSKSALCSAEALTVRICIMQCSKCCMAAAGSLCLHSAVSKPKFMTDTMSGTLFSQLLLPEDESAGASQGCSLAGWPKSLNAFSSLQSV